MRKVRRGLPHPVTGEMKYFWLEKPEDAKVFEQTRQAWGEIARQRAAQSGQDATAVEPANKKQVMGPGGPRPSADMPARAAERPVLTDEQVLRSMAPAGIASLASLVPAARYGMLLRTLLAGAGGALGAPIAGTDPMVEARNQALMQVPGELIAGTFGALGRGAMRKPLNADPELNANFGDIGGSALRERIGVSNPRTISEGPEVAGLGEKALGNFGPLTGSREASRRLGELRQRIVSRLGMSRKQYDLEKDFLATVRKELRDELGQLPRPTAAIDEMEDVLKQTVAENFTTMTPLQAWEMRKGAQTSAADLLKKSNRPTASSAAEANRADMEARVDKKLQEVINRRLREDFGNIGYGKMMDRYRELEGIRRASEMAETGRDATASPRAVAGATSPRAAFNPLEMLSPQAFTTLGRSLDHPLTRWGFGSVPRGAQEGARLSDPTVEWGDWMYPKPGTGQ